MSFTPPFKYINADELAAMIKSTPAKEVSKDFAVIDVRSDDFVGGNIVNCINSPAETIHVDVDGLVNKLQGVPKVVFHCALSQQRGPISARIYSESLSPEQKEKQQVYVLRDGFTGFQQKFRTAEQALTMQNDPELIEKFNKRYHD